MNKYKRAKRIFFISIIVIVIVMFLRFTYQSHPNISISERDNYKLSHDDYISQPYFTRDGANMCKVTDGYCINRDGDIYWYSSDLTTNRLVTTDSDIHNNLYGYNGNVYTFKHIDAKVWVVSIDINSGDISELFEVGNYENDYFSSFKMAVDNDNIYVTDGKVAKRIRIYQYNKSTKDKHIIADFSGKSPYFSDLKIYGGELFYSISGDDNYGMKIAKLFKYNPATNDTMQISTTNLKYFTVSIKECLIFGFNETNCSLLESNLDSDKFSFSRIYDIDTNDIDDAYVFSDDNYFYTVINNNSSKDIIIRKVLATSSSNFATISIPADDDVVFADDRYIFFSSGNVLEKTDLNNKTYDDIYTCIFDN